MELTQLRSIIEALIFVSEEPLTTGAIALMLEQDGVTKADVETALSNHLKALFGEPRCCPTTRCS